MQSETHAPIDSKGDGKDLSNKGEREGSPRRLSTAKKKEEHDPEITEELRQPLAATNPSGVPSFQLNPTSLTPAVEDMTDSM